MQSKLFMRVPFSLALPVEIQFRTCPIILLQTFRANCDNKIDQPLTQALSSMRRRGGKTLVGAGHVIDQILIA